MLKKMFEKMSVNCSKMAAKCADAEAKRKQRAIEAIEDEIKGLEAYKASLMKEETN